MAVCVGTNGTDLILNNVSIGSCTDYVLLTASDYATVSPSLSLDDTVQLCGAIITVWAVAYCFKLIRRSL